MRGRGPPAILPLSSHAGRQPGQQHPWVAPFVGFLLSGRQRLRRGWGEEEAELEPGRETGRDRDCQPVSWLGRLTSGGCGVETDSRFREGSALGRCLGQRWDHLQDPALAAPAPGPSTWGADPGVHMLMGPGRARGCRGEHLSCHAGRPARRQPALGPLRLLAPRRGLRAQRAVLLPEAWGSTWTLGRPESPPFGNARDQHRTVCLRQVPPWSCCPGCGAGTPGAEPGAAPGELGGPLTPSPHSAKWASVGPGDRVSLHEVTQWGAGGLTLLRGLRACLSNPKQRAPGSWGRATDPRLLFPREPLLESRAWVCFLHVCIVAQCAQLAWRTQQAQGTQ